MKIRYLLHAVLKKAQECAAAAAVRVDRIRVSPLLQSELFHAGHSLAMSPPQGIALSERDVL